MRRYATPLALVATVVSTFIIAKGCLPKEDRGNRAASSVGPRLPKNTPALNGDSQGKAVPPK